ncbi:hypothetical protein AAE478_006783 [Parahypoxylon ruwenzoriense]
MDPDLSSGLLDIQLSDSSEEEDSNATAVATTNGDASPNKNSTSNGAGAPTSRTAQSEDDFQTVRRGYRVKVENGEIHKTIHLPPAPARVVSKPEAQALLHAVEELYFFRRYAEGARFARAALGGGRDGDGDSSKGNGNGNGNGNGTSGLDDDTRTMLRYYERKYISVTASVPGYQKQAS